MVEIIQQLSLLGKFFSQNIENFLEPFLQNLDPALFQNVIIGILMLLIFIGEQIFSEVKTQAKRGEFLKMVIFYEILNITSIAVLAVFSIFIISFFKDSVDNQAIHSVGQKTKIMVIIFTAVVAYILIKPIFKFQVFFRGKRHNFEMAFLKGLNFSKILKFINQAKAEKMIRAWNSFWSEKSEFNERDFTEVFISHIDDSFKFNELGFAVDLSQSYVSNIEKRERFSMGYDVLPKIFEWNEFVWNEQQLLQKSYDTEKKIQHLFSLKCFSIFRSSVLKLYKKTISKREHFWNWNYFSIEFFQAIIKILLKDGHGPFQLFASFKKHIKECMEKLYAIEDGRKREEYYQYVKGLFASFCPTFFNEISNAPSHYDIWKHYFPEEWKILKSNANSEISRVILLEFLQWSQERIFKKNSQTGFDKDLTEVINGIFPNVHPSLFTAFLKLFFIGEIKYALESESNFYISGISVTWAGRAEEGRRDGDKRIAEMMKTKDSSQKEETISIILDFFSSEWDKLQITLDDSNNRQWEKADNDEKDSMLKIARKEKLEKMKTELEEVYIKEMCKDNDSREQNRQDFLELINLLLLKV